MTPRARPVLPALALSCSAEGVSAALVTARESGKVAIEGWHDAGTSTRSDALLGMIDSLLAANRTPASAIRHLSVDIGPGPFTALRMTCAIAQGVALASGATHSPVWTTEALAWQAVAGQPEGRHRVFVAIDARMGEAYAATVEIEVDPAGELRSIRESTPCVVVAPASVWEAAGPGFAGEGARVLYLAGNAFERIPGFAESVGRQAREAQWSVIRPRAAVSVRASAVAQIGLYRAAVAGNADAVSGLDGDAAALAPRYIRNKVALDVDEQAAARLHGSKEGPR